jgi:hypothetical protein
MSRMSLNLMSLAKQLIAHAYPELSQTNITIDYGRTSSYANVRWGREDGIQVTCSVSSRDWPEPALLGLIAHELSHPVQTQDWHSEMKTDQDVLSRGLGPYLAMERVLTGKYEDHSLRGGIDRYLGYSTIRDLLNPRETSNLDRLLDDFRLVPSKFLRKDLDILHDTITFDERRSTTMVVEGRLLVLPPVPSDADIKILVRNNHAIIYVDDLEIGDFLLEEDH